MKMNSAKRLAARFLNVGATKVKVDGSKLKEVKEAMTGDDIKGLIGDKTFTKNATGQSRGRARALAEKKKKGRKKGIGKRKGTMKARTNPKELWLKKVRAQRLYIKKLLAEEKVDSKSYRDLYRKVKGGFFRTKSHIDVYLSKKD